MKTNNFFRRVSVVSTVAVMATVAGFMAGCGKEETSEENPFRPVALSEIPEGVVPLEFASVQEAKAFLADLKAKREKEGKIEINQYFGVKPESEILKTPRLKSGSEQSGGSQKLGPSGWWFQSLTTYITYNSIGGPVTITSSMTGFTFSVGWEQKSYTYYWNGSCINYTVYGDEIIYSSSLFEVSRNSVSVSSTFCN